MELSDDVGSMTIKLNVQHNWRVHRCVGINVSEFCEKERVRRRDFRYTCQIITHDVIRRKSSRDGSCRVTHVKEWHA